MSDNATRAQKSWVARAGNAMLVAGAILCFGLALWFAFRDVAAATLMAGLFVALLLLRVLPELESFKAFGLEAKMRAQITEAEQTLARLRNAMMVFGRFSYHMFGAGSRAGHPVGQKQALADEIDQLLSGMGVSAGDIKAMKKSYIYYGLYDLFAIHARLVERCVQTNWSQARQEMAALPDNAMNPNVLEVRVRRDALERLAKSVHRDFSEREFRDSCLRICPRDGLIGEDAKKLREVAERIGSLGEECRRQGRIVEGAVELIEKFSGGGTDRLYEEVFGRAPAP